jgi:HK97 family phage major capsid protein
MALPEELKEALDDVHKSIGAKNTEAKNALEALDGRVNKIADEIERHGKETSEAKDAFQNQSVKFNELADEHKELTQKFAELMRGPGSPTAQKSLGQLAVDSELMKKGSRARGDLVSADDSGLGLIGQQKAVSTADASAGPLVPTQQRPGIMYDPLERLTVRDLLTVLPTSESMVEWYREKMFTNSADIVAELAQKPESDITFEKASTGMEVIAHWIMASNQILSDVPRLRAHIDMRMTHGLKLKEEEQLLLGDGTGDNLHGLIPQATDYDGAAVGADAVNDTNIDTLRRALLQAELAQYPADSFIMHPKDWTDIELAKTDDKAYLFTDPKTGTGQMLWGRRVATSTAMPAGEYLTGSLRLGATMYDREAMSVRLADQHGDVFTKNAVIILVEERIGLAVERPAAIIKGAFA